MNSVMIFQKEYFHYSILWLCAVSDICTYIPLYCMRVLVLLCLYCCARAVCSLLPGSAYTHIPYNFLNIFSVSSFGTVFNFAHIMFMYIRYICKYIWHGLWSAQQYHRSQSPQSHTHRSIHMRRWSEKCELLCRVLLSFWKESCNFELSFSFLYYFFVRHHHTTIIIITVE